MAKIVIGLTGLIGSGKSTIAQLFADRGASIIDTDVIAHQLTAVNGMALPAIQREFGDDLVDSAGILNRIRLREMIFNDNDSHQRLERLMHPLIVAEAKNQLENSYSHSDCYAMLVVPLLFRAPDYLAITCRNIFVDTEYPVLLERLKQRSGLSQEMVDAILKRQVARDTQLELADDVIVNNNGVEALIPQIDQLHTQYLLLGN
jgi:dephospho-CoA kinase